MDIEWIKNLPKVDLHCHLDGSLGIKVIRQLLPKAELPVQDACLMKKLQMTQGNLTQYLEKFNIPIQCLQTRKGLQLAVIHLMEDAAAENVKYIEIRFAPLLSVNKELDCRGVIESVLEGVKQGEKKYNIYGSVIVCAMRNHSVEKNIKMLTIAREYYNSGVCALDLAGDESKYITNEQKKLFLLAQKWEIPFTIHSGECGSIKNVKDAIELGARRLGHGIALQKDEKLIEICKDKQIGIELCPSSNFQTKAVNSWIDYPLKTFFEKGLLVSINTDNRTVSNTSIVKELRLVYENVSQNKDMIRRLLQNAVKVSFAKEEIKEEILREIQEAF